MGKSGNINRFKPTDTSWAIKFPECAALLRTTGWFSFFNKTTGFNPEVSHHFTQNFINEIVTFNTLMFELIEDLIAEAIGVPTYGESWFKKIPSSFDPNYFYYQEMKPQIGEKEFHQKILSQNGRKPLVLYRTILHAMTGSHQYLNTMLDFYSI